MSKDKRVLMVGRFREHFDPDVIKAIKFDDAAKQRFLDHYAKHGRVGQAATAAGVVLMTVLKHRKSDPTFQLAYEEAQQQYADHIQEQVYKQAVEGVVVEPIMGGKDRDIVVGERRQYSPNLLALEAKRVNPEYRERQQLDVAVSGGVLLIPQGMSADEWTKEYGQSTNTTEIPYKELPDPDEPSSTEK